MATSPVALIGELNRIKLPAAELEAIDKAYVAYQEQSSSEFEDLLEVGVTLEGVTGLWPFTYNSITVFARWNEKGPCLDIYAVGSGSSVYMLSTFKSAVPASYRLDARDQTLRKVSVPSL